MATDGPDPKPCDQEIYTSGATVFITHLIPSNAMDQWVKSVAEESNQKVDWHFAGGRAVVKALGDLHKVRAAILELIPEHNRLQKKEHDKIPLHIPYSPSFLLY